METDQWKTIYARKGFYRKCKGTSNGPIAVRLMWGFRSDWRCGILFRIGQCYPILVVQISWRRMFYRYHFTGHRKVSTVNAWFSEGVQLNSRRNGQLHLPRQLLVAISVEVSMGRLYYEISSLKIVVNCIRKSY